MLLSDFDYHLPAELIAQHPTKLRTDARLLSLDKKAGLLEDKLVSSIKDLFRPGDLLVLNDTKVIPARLNGVKESGGAVEVFLVKRLSGLPEIWNCLIKSSKTPKNGCRIKFGSEVSAKVLSRESGLWQVSFEGCENFVEWLDKSGSIPLPPYIKRESEHDDSERYQTVFATNRGAVAAPTAGLHFTAELLNELVGIGVQVVPLTLHVGLGTFLPIRVEELSQHKMHSENYYIPVSTVDAIKRTKQTGGRVVSLGTTTLRALEHASAKGELSGGEGEADIFILPGYNFRVVDALITNFHLPKSTLFMLVCAFVGKENAYKAYCEAIRLRYRFFSYGDAMFIQ